MAPPLCTYEQACENAAQVASAAWAELARKSAEQAAEDAWPGGLSRQEIADRIRMYRQQARQIAA